MQNIADESILEAFDRDEMLYPSPRKFVDGHPIHASHRLTLNVWDIVLSDFGSAVSGDVKNDTDAQPTFYRSLEVMLLIEWSSLIGTWNVGVVIRVNLLLMTNYVLT